MRTRTNLSAGELKVYGTTDCGWTQKQIAYLNRKGTAFSFIDCDAQTCPDFVKAYPTLVIDGKASVGFQEI